MKCPLVALLCLLFPLQLGAEAQFGAMVPVCTVSFIAKTQAGEMLCHVAVCRMESKVGSSSSLYVMTAYDREYSPRIEKILELSHSPIIEKWGERIVILYTSGVNTTLVAEFSVEKGLLEYLSEEAISWNDQGTHRTSPSFARYSELLRRRNEPNKRVQPKAASGRG